MNEWMLPLAQLSGEAKISEFFAYAIVLFLGIGIHEYAHAKFADMAGDPTPGFHGRVTLNLFNHFDPLGGLLLLFMAWSGFGFGWGRPVPVDPSKMRNPRVDYFVAVAAGPISNLLQACIYALIFRVIHSGPGIQESDFFSLFALIGVLVNVTLFLFNLIPLGPLDGAKIVGTMLPDNLADKWTYFNDRAGSFIFLGLIFLSLAGTNVFGVVLGPFRRVIEGLLLGV